MSGANMDRDVTSARALLAGFISQKAGRPPRHEYLKAESADEKEARRALARLLRAERPLDRQLRESLATLLDPEPPEWQQRKITITSRRQGPHTEHVRNTQIAEGIWSDVGGGKSVAAAITRIASSFAVSEDTVKKVWGGYRPLLEKIHGRRISRHRTRR